MAMDARRLDGKVAIVTGGGGAIGTATVLRLARAGALVAVADIRKEPAEQAAAAALAEGLVAEAFAVNLASEEEIEALVAAVLARFGRIDIVHNNAAAGGRIFAGDRTLLDMTAKVWDTTFAVNVRGPMLLSKLAIPHMIAQGGGVIINTSTGATGIISAEARIAYGSSKSALQTLTRYIAAQYGDRNIRCNAVLPGVVMTPGMYERYGQDAVDAMSSRTLLRRGCTPEDIAATVHFLASDDARQITGEVIRVDAGGPRT